MQGDYAASYEKNTLTSDPASELVRDVFYVRGSDYIITYDRATTTQPQYLKQLQWNFTGTPTVSGDSWSVANGSSKLFGQTYSDVPLTTIGRAVMDGGTSVPEVITNNSSPTASVRYVTAMQTTGSGTNAMDASAHVESDDGKIEGVQIGNYVIMFGRNGLVSGGTSYSVTSANGKVVTHYISDLSPNATFALTGANQATATVSAQGVLTFTTTGTGSAQTITISAGNQANSAPTATDQTVNVAANTPTNIAMDVFDADNDPLTFQVTSSSGGTLGTFSSDGHVTFTPTPGFTGTAWFTYTVTDNKSAPVSASVTIQVYSPQNVVINIADGQTYTLNSNLSGFTSLTIEGAGPNSVLDGNGFQIYNDNLLGNVTISNVTLRNLGQNWIDSSTGTLINSNSNYAIYLQAMGTADVTIADTVFDASSSVFLFNDVDSTATIERNTVLSNSLAPGGVRPDVSAPFFTAQGWQSKYPKVFEGNRIYQSYISFGPAKDWQITDNIIDGERGGIAIGRSDEIEIAYNYIHCLHDFAASNPDNPYGSQVSNLSFDQSTNVSTHDNFLQDGEWMVRGLDGDFYNNVLVDLQSHDWIIDPQAGAKIHDNIFGPRYDGQVVFHDAGIYAYDTTATDVEIYNNTFDGGQGFVGPVLAVGPGVTIASVRNNLFYDLYTNWPWGNGVIRPSWGETLSGSPPRPSSDPDRMTYANYNAFYNPNATAGTINYAIGVDGATYGSAAFGSGDVNGVDPKLKSPPTAFPFSDVDIESRVVTVRQMLATYRDAYTPLPGSPLIRAADPQDAASGRTNIGAV
jgi:hypothetical protein